MLLKRAGVAGVQQESGGCEVENPGEREVVEKHWQLLAEAAAPCPTAKPCKGQEKSRAGSALGSLLPAVLEFQMWPQ